LGGRGLLLLGVGPRVALRLLGLLAVALGRPVALWGLLWGRPVPLWGPVALWGALGRAGVPTLLVGSWLAGVSWITHLSAVG